MNEPLNSQDKDEEIPGSTLRNVLYWLSRLSVAAGVVVAVDSINSIKNGASRFTPFLYVAVVMIGLGIYGQSHFYIDVSAMDARKGTLIFWILMAAMFIVVFASRRLFK